jgi:hypothetical protein
LAIEPSPVEAVVAADGYLRALDPATTEGSSLVTLRAITLPRLTSQALRARAAAVTVAREASASGAGFMRGWQLGWRVISYTPPVARVAIWTMGLAAAPNEVVAPDWSTTLCTLRRVGRAWRVQEAATSPGPTPPSDGSDRAAVAAFARAAATFNSFNDAP